MSAASAKLWMDRAKNDPWYLSQMPIRLDSLDKAIGFNGFKGAKFGNITANAWRALENIIPRIENREIIFMPKNEIIVIDAGEPSIVKRLTTSWSLNIRCTCGSNQFLPLMIEKEYAACYLCIPPNQYKAIAAKEIKRSLIHEAMKNYYIAQ